MKIITIILLFFLSGESGLFESARRRYYYTKIFVERTASKGHGATVYTFITHSVLHNIISLL